MPRRKLKMSEKIKIFLIWMRGNASISLLLTCGRCGSINIELVKSEKEEHSSTINQYKARYHCRSCNAIGANTETWSDSMKK